jgi:hypothetical protein
VYVTSHGQIFTEAFGFAGSCCSQGTVICVRDTKYMPNFDGEAYSKEITKIIEEGIGRLIQDGS